MGKKNSKGLRRNNNILKFILSVQFFIISMSMLLFTVLTSSQAFAQKDYTLFEVDPVRPVLSFSDGRFVAALNIPDDYVELFKSTKKGVKHCTSIKVGMRPVAMAIVSESRSRAQLWVVNHLSDSISVLDLNLDKCRGKTVDTILVGDEPRDIVVANTPVGKRVFVSMSHRGQTHPDYETRKWGDLVRSSAENAELGRPAGLADVVVFNPDNKDIVKIINLFTDSQRSLALGPPDESGFHQQVFAAGFHTGNKTTTIAQETVRLVALEHLHELMEHGDVIETANGDLVVAKNGIKMHGGTPAVKGKGRCMPDPRPERVRRHELQLCVKTDDHHEILSFVPQIAGVVDESCSCSNASGQVQPTVGVIAKFYDSKETCGEAFSSNIGGCWFDQNLEMTGNSSPPMEWNDSVKFSLPDKDVFEIRISKNTDVYTISDYSGVGTVLFGMAVHPKSGSIYVVNQDSNNTTQFEGFGHFSESTVRGNIVQSRISIIHQDGSIDFKNLNDHINFQSGISESDRSFAFPVAIEITNKTNDHGKYEENQQLYFAALGSDKIGYVSTEALDKANSGEVNQELKYLNISGKSKDDREVIAGPVGLSMDHKRQRLYVLARFSNELIVVDTKNETPKIKARYAMYNPEDESITDGRSVLYNATDMSANGDQACASCHIYSNNDSLAWDLGNPDIDSVNNPGPFISPPAVGFVADLARDPESHNPYLAVVNPDFRANKGAMVTQPLRGLANHGALHWRGDRVRRVQNTTGVQPDTGPFDENSSIQEFDEAVVGLVGGDKPLTHRKIDELSNFLLKISYPPNPLRRLDNTLTPMEEAGRAVFFGCASMTDEQFENRVCVAPNGQIVDVNTSTRECECFGNPIRFVMHRLIYVQDFAKAFLKLKISVPAGGSEQQFIEYLQDLYDNLYPIAQQIKNLKRQPLSSFAVEGNVASLNHEAQIYDQSQLQLIQEFVTGVEGNHNSNSVLKFIEAIQDVERKTNSEILEPLLAQLDLSGIPIEQANRLMDPQQISAAMKEWFGDANVSRVPLLDAALSPGQEQDPLLGCGIVKMEQSCSLRIADSINTCQGCHVLDHDANREYEVEFPGFFGTSGKYAFANIPQVFKVPHLRNLYSRVGKFGQPYEFDMFVAQSVFGIRKGGFFDRKTPVVGPSVRGFGFSHDGSTDTLHRFAGLLDFLRRPALFLDANDVRGNPDAFDAFVPTNPEACLNLVRQEKDEFFVQLQADRDQMTQVAIAAISGDKAASEKIVQTVLSSPAIFYDARWKAIAGPALRALENKKPISADHGAPIVEAVASLLLCPNVPSPELLPLCFQLGSSLEFGSENGVCYPTGLIEREAGEAFMLTFDTNLKPMVGKQVTLKPQASKSSLNFFKKMIAAASEEHCDIGAWDRRRGYLLVAPNSIDPMSSVLLNDNGKELTVADLRARKKRVITFTCYPPQPDKMEARRSVLDRDGDGELNGKDRVKAVITTFKGKGDEG